MWHTRFNGSIPDSVNLDQPGLNALRAEARALADATDNPRARGQFLIAESFVPFWNRSMSIQTSAAELDLADESAAAGLAIADRLGDATLISAAHDGIGSTAQERGDWFLARETNRQRLQLADRLILREVVDAQTMVALANAILGDLEEGERDSAAALAALRPGQVPNWALHLTSWRTYTLALAGRWDEALAAGERARQLWIEIGRGPAAYAQLGFVSALQISRSRRDERRTDVFEGVWDEIRRRFGLNARNQFGQDIRSGSLRAELPAIDAFSGIGAANLERWLQAATDSGVVLPVALLAPIIERALATNARPVAVEVLRAMGLATGNVDRLREALAIAEGMGGKPAIGRLRCEIARLTGDAALADAGRQVLREIGDVVSLDRYEA